MLITPCHSYDSDDDSLEDVLELEIDDIAPLSPIVIENLFTLKEYDGKSSGIVDDQFIKTAWDMYDIELLRNEVLVWRQLRTLNSKHFATILQYGRVHDRDVVVYDKITGIILKEYIIHCTYDQFRFIIMDILTILYEANTKIGFTHYDVHLANIIITPDNVPVFIDYGLSYTTNDSRTGIIMPHAKISKSTWWAHDIIKLMCCLILATDIDLIMELARNHYHVERGIIKVSDIDDIARDTHMTLRDLYISNAEHGGQVPQLLALHTARYKEKCSALQDQTLHLNSMHHLVLQIMSYFTVLIGDPNSTPLTDPKKYIRYLAGQLELYSISQAETTGGSFEDFIAHSKKFL
jgi:hypothetical protein